MRRHSLRIFQRGSISIMNNIFYVIAEHYIQHIMKNHSLILTNTAFFVITHKNLISREQTCHIFDIAISWETRKIQTLFRLKDNKLHPAYNIYYGVCECG